MHTIFWSVGFALSSEINKLAAIGCIDTVIWDAGGRALNSSFVYFKLTSFSK